MRRARHHASRALLERGPPAPRLLRALAACLSLWGTPEEAFAAPPRIRGNDYSIELFQGPLIAPTRVLGLAGAFTGYAEGGDGISSNAAAPAVREPYSATWFDYDVALSLSFPGAFSQTDFDNRGRRGDVSTSRFDNFLYLNVGLLAQVGELGVAATGDLQKFDLSSGTSGGAGLTLDVARWHALGAYGFAGNQVVVGAGARIVTLQILQAGGLFRATQIIGSQSILTMVGAAPEAGVLIKPTGSPFRLGASVRAPVAGGTVGSGLATVDAVGVRHVGSFAPPESVLQPWEAEVGVALQVGPRPINPAWLDPEAQEQPLEDEIDRARDVRKKKAAARIEAARTAADRKREEALVLAEETVLRGDEERRTKEWHDRLLGERRARYANWPREKLLLVASVLLTGPSTRAVAVESFLDQVDEPYGAALSVSPRVGVEAEPWVGRLIARAGSYVEPSRFASGSFRQHFTVGAEVRLFDWDVFGITSRQTFKLNLAGDVAPRYTNTSVGLGIWH